MNLLIDPLPESVEIGGKAYPIRSGFRTSILFENMMMDLSVPADEKPEIALALYYPAPPPDAGAALDGIMRFYRCGQPEQADKAAKGKSKGRAYSFEHDDRYIYAAFLEQYGIDLNEAELHWWKFRALLEALSPDALFCKIMGWRSAEPNTKMPAAEKKRLRELKKLYALPRPVEEEARVAEITAYLTGIGN